MPYNSLVVAPDVTTEGDRPAMTNYLIAVVVFVAIITTLLYLWKRDHG
jgi:hypothetical protein